MGKSNLSGMDHIHHAVCAVLGADWPDLSGVEEKAYVTALCEWLDATGSWSASCAEIRETIETALDVSGLYLDAQSRLVTCALLACDLCAVQISEIDEWRAGLPPASSVATACQYLELPESPLEWPEILVPGGCEDEEDLLYSFRSRVRRMRVTLSPRTGEAMFGILSGVWTHREAIGWCA